MNDSSHLRELRLCEARVALPFAPKGARLLEIGAGSGWQSKLFAEHGCQVSAIDLETSQYVTKAVHPVQFYDGHTIPFADATFDMVYSSNVLEHIPRSDVFQREIRRVLKSDGRAVHILPTPGWRLWTNVTHYLSLPQRVLRARQRGAGPQGAENPDASVQPPSASHRLIGNLWPAPHGELGNCVSELYYFSSARWQPLFEACGFRVLERHPTRLFYTGYSLADRRIGIGMRQTLSRVLGSACSIYVLECA